MLTVKLYLCNMNTTQYYTTDMLFCKIRTVSIMCTFELVLCVLKASVIGVYICMHTYIHSYIHITFIHTYIHTLHSYVHTHTIVHNIIDYSYGC